MKDKEVIKEMITEKTARDLVYSGYQDFSSYVTRERLVAKLEDGLIPAYRRTILAAYKICSKNFIKTVTLSGDTVGYYHPHSQSAIDDVIAELVHIGILVGEGAWGKKMLVGEDAPPGASRYTFVKLNPEVTKILDNFLKYVPLVDGEMDNKEAKFIPFPLPILCNYGTFSLAPGLRVQLPAFTFSSMLEAYKKNNPLLLKSTFGYKIVNADIALKDIWETGKTNIWYTMDVMKETLDGQRGVIIKGSAEIFKPRLDLLAEWKNDGLIFVNDISNEKEDKIFIGINPGVKTLSLDEVYETARKACVNMSTVQMYSLVENTAHPMGLKAWIESTLNTYHGVVENYKKDQIQIQKDLIELMSYFVIVRDFIIKNINKHSLTIEQIIEATKAPEHIVRKIDSMSVKVLRTTDPDAETNKAKDIIKEIEAISSTKMVNDLVKKINIDPTYEMTNPLTMKDINNMNIKLRMRTAKDETNN